MKIPFSFQTQPDWPDHSNPPSIEYDTEPYLPTCGANAQPILKGRTILHPTVDLNNYRCRSVIDWIAVHLQTDDVHQAINIQRWVTKLSGRVGSDSSVFVSGPNGESRYIGTAFLLRFQQPQSNKLYDVLGYILSKYAPALETPDNIYIAALEISVDFYVKSKRIQNQDAQNLMRWQMVDILRRHLRPEGILTEIDEGHPRFYSETHGKPGATFLLNPKLPPSSNLISRASHLNLDISLLPALWLSSHAQPYIDTTAYIGPKGFPLELKSMDKLTDQRNTAAGTAVDLAPDKYRARLEITLQGGYGMAGGHGAVGLHTIRDLYDFQFQALRPLAFEFFNPTFSNPCETGSLGFPVNVAQTSVFRRSGVYGLDRLHRAIEAVNSARYRKREVLEKPRKLGKKGKLVSYKALNQKVDRALRKLSRDWEHPSLSGSS